MVARLRLVVLAAIVVLSTPTGAKANVINCPAKRGNPKATVVVIPTGFFYIGTAQTTEPECRYFSAKGYDSVSVGYRPGDYFGSLQAARQAARRARRSLRPVYAVGWSTGGNLSAMLALLGEVDGAVAIAAPTNLVTWAADNSNYWTGVMHMTLDDRRRASPYYRYAQAVARPMLLMHSRADSLVPYQQSVGFAGKSHSRLVPLRGAHLADKSALRRSWRWVSQRVRHDGE